MTEGRIGRREAVCITSVSCISKTLFTYNAFTGINGSNVWQGFGVSAVMSAIVILFAAFAIKRTGAKDLEGALERTIGSVGVKVFNVLFAAVQWFGVFMLLRGFTQIIATNIFEYSPVWYINVLMMATALPIAWMGLEACTRTAVIILPLILISAFILLGGVTASLDGANLFPLGGSGAAAIVENGIAKLYQWSDMLMVLMLIQPLQGKKTAASALKGSFITSLITSGIWTVFACMCFSRARLSNMPTVAYELSELVNANGTLKTSGLALVYVWLAGVLLTIAYSLYTSARQLSAAFSIQNHRAILPPLFAMVVFAQVIWESVQGTVTQLVDMATTWLFLAPTLLLLLSAVLSLRRKTHEK